MLHVYDTYKLGDASILKQTEITEKILNEYHNRQLKIIYSRFSLT